jgi:ankyrin repeat protein
MKSIRILRIVCLLTACLCVQAGEIHELAKSGSFEDIKKFVQAHPAAVNERGPLMTPLHWAAIKNRTNVVEFLLKSGADASAVAAGQTPGHLAAMHGHFEVAKLLFASKPQLLNAKGGGGMTMVMFAARATNAPLVEFLITNKADLNLQDDLGLTALNYSRSKEVSDLLRRHGAK